MRGLSRDTDPLGLPFDGLLDLSWSLFSIVEEPSICFIAFVWTRRMRKQTDHHLNALKHGAFSRTLILPWESIAEFAEL
jgi:hypothetical protein